MTTRQTLVEDMNDIETVLLHLDGVTPRPEISDKTMKRMIFRCLWHIMDYILRKTWKG